MNLVGCIGVDFVNHDIGQKSPTGYCKARARKYSELYSSVVQYGEGVICFSIVHYGEGVTFLSVVQYVKGVTLLRGFSKKLLGFNPFLIWDLGNTELFILYHKVHILAGTIFSSSFYSDSALWARSVIGATCLSMTNVSEAPGYGN